MEIKAELSTLKTEQIILLNSINFIQTMLMDMEAHYLQQLDHSLRLVIQSSSTMKLFQTQLYLPYLLLKYILWSSILHIFKTILPEAI